MWVLILQWLDAPVKGIARWSFVRCRVVIIDKEEVKRVVVMDSVHAASRTKKREEGKAKAKGKGKGKK